MSLIETRSRADHSGGLGLDESDVAWAKRFGQVSRMAIVRQRLHTVTGLAESLRSQTGILLCGFPKCLLTVWSSGTCC